MNIRTTRPRRNPVFQCPAALLVVVVSQQVCACFCTRTCVCVCACVCLFLNFQVTRLGRCVNDLRKKTTSEELSKKAKLLVKKWQKLVKSDCASRASTPNGLPFAPSNTTALLKKVATEVATENSESAGADSAKAAHSAGAPADVADSLSVASSSALATRAEYCQSSSTLRSSAYAVPVPEEAVERPSEPCWLRQWHGVDGRRRHDGEWASWTSGMPSADGTVVASPYVYLE